MARWKRESTHSARCRSCCCVTQSTDWDAPGVEHAFCVGDFHAILNGDLRRHVKQVVAFAPLFGVELPQAEPDRRTKLAGVLDLLRRVVLHTHGAFSCLCPSGAATGGASHLWARWHNGLAKIHQIKIGGATSYREASQQKLAHAIKV